MTELTIFEDKCSTVFGLNGYDENSATYALGWSLRQSSHLLEKLVKLCLGEHVNVERDKITIELQKHSRKDNGYTDIEIKHSGYFHLIIEAKKGWILPTKTQLTRYTSRFTTGVKNQKLITMSAASVEYAKRLLPEMIEAYPVQHLSWKEIFDLATIAKNITASRTEKLWLTQFEAHIKRYISMTLPTSNLAYCVVISTKNIRSSKNYTWVDVIETDNKYFHPVGGQWPSSPPNYIAFRRKGALTSVHHIESYDVVNNLNDVNPNWPVTSEDYFVYKLGGAMYPPKKIKNGNLYATGRYWCALDTLLSGDYESISDARDETQRRTA